VECVAAGEFQVFRGREAKKISGDPMVWSERLRLPNWRPSEMSDYYEGLNGKLLAAIPPSKKVLELGCGAGHLGRRYKELNPGAQWHGVDFHNPSVEKAAKYLDQVWTANLDQADIEMFGTGYDCIVMGDVLEHLKAPELLVAALRRITTPCGQLVCCIPNMTHVSIVERMLIGDLSYDENGLMDRTHLRFFSQSSIFKLFLDSGWLPNLQDQYYSGHANAGLTAGLVACANSLGVSKETAERALFTYQMIIACRRFEDTSSRTTVPLSVIVPVNSDAQFELNVARSPGLREIGAQILPCWGAQSAADAFARGRGQASGEWLLFCHQDVYFPVGSGFALSNILAGVLPERAERTVVGFAGIGTKSPSDPYAQTFNAGLAIDRMRLYDCPEADSAVSLDEVAVVMHRDTPLKIDPTMGWHLWATDLCLAATRGAPAFFPRIVRIPIYHNSLSGHSLPAAFQGSAATLAAKYPDTVGIRSLCATIT
jgi:SAM-dependent methyltransferase